MTDNSDGSNNKLSLNDFIRVRILVYCAREMIMYNVHTTHTLPVYVKVGHHTHTHTYEHQRGNL